MIFSSTVTKDMTIYARWQVENDYQPNWGYTGDNTTGNNSGNNNAMPVKYTVKFDSNGGSKIEDQIIVDGNNAIKPKDPIKEGYIFDGWYMDSEFKETFDFKMGITKNVTLYAKWTNKITYTVTFDSNGGNKIQEQIIEDGNCAIIPDNPIRNGYIFDGWYTGKEQNEKFNFESIILENITLYAKWIIDDNVKFDLGKIENLVSDGTITISQKNDTSIKFMDGVFLNKEVNNTSDALDILDKVSPILTVDDNNIVETIGDIETYSENFGSDFEENYYLFKPEIGGIPVEGSDIILITGDDHIPQVLINSYNNDIEKVNIIPDEDVTNSIEDIIKNNIMSNVKEGVESELISAILESLSYDKKLVIYAIGEDKKPQLAWKVIVTSKTNIEEGGNVIDDIDIESLSESMVPNICLSYYICANGSDGGSIIVQSPVGQGIWTPTQAEGEDIKGNSQTFNCEVQDNEYRMVDNIRNISTYRTLYRSYGFLGLGKQEAVLPGEISKKGLFGWNKKTVSAHTTMAKAYDYYKNNLNRKSYDGSGDDIKLSVEYVPDSTNAFGWLFNVFFNSNACWHPYYKQFMFNNAGGFEAALDVCGHEFTHAVINTIVGGKSLETTLTYIGETGALNESYADILGCLIERKTGHDKWLISEDATDGAIRDMSNPSVYDQPDHYDNKYTGDNNSKYVHTNSGIFNYAAYKMMTDNRTSNISDDKWAKVFYKSLYRLTTDADFLEASLAVINSAKTLGFTYDQVEAIRDAYKAVGIIEDNTVRIVLRWGEIPQDLDAHLVGPAVNDGEKFHVYFSNKHYYSENEDNIADLDYDYTNGNGIEIISIRTLTPGDYYYYVHDYSNKGSTDSMEMSKSDAIVKVYQGTTNEILKTTDGKDASFNIDKTKNATLWTVMHIHINENHTIDIKSENNYAYHYNEDTIGQ